MIRSTIARLNEASSEYEIRKLLNYANWTKPTGKMRRSYIKAANARRKELNGK